LLVNKSIKPIQRIMIGHGMLIMFVALMTGLLLWVSVLGGFEIFPGYVLQINLEGTPEGWARAHRGIPMNSLMLILFALVISSIGLEAKLENQFGWLFIGTAWANTIFYIAANFSQNRALSFGANKYGDSNLFSFLALAPAYLFGVLSMAAILFIAVKCLFFKKS
jgi:hypothetical protein